MRVGLLLFIFTFPLTSVAESTDDFGRLRLKHAYYVGPSLTMGRLDARADNATTKIKLTSLAGIRFGLERWPDESMGVLLAGEMGFPATIDNVLGNDVRFTRHQLLAGITYRYFMGPRPLASAFFVSSLVNVSMDDVQEQQPAVILSRVIIAPNLRFGYERFLIADTTWIRAYLGLGYPFFVRETPSDSGRPDSMFDARAAVEVCHYLSDRWGLLMGIDHTRQSFQHGGEATRAGGVNDVVVLDMYTAVTVSMRYVPKP